ncbi:MAG TPA: alpha/beta hydrolase [Burkholderiales bacterium]|nr:alpha/beta hydrolase [Burkholderiales bacterium]
MEWGLLGALAKLGGVIYLGISLSAYLLQDKLIFQPQALSEAQRSQIAARHPNVSDIFLQAEDGTRLHAWHFKTGAEAPLVIYFGGNAEEVSWMLDQLAYRSNARKSTTAWLLVDYRGYGASAGEPSEEALTSDALAWYDFAAQQSKRIYVFGRSLGSGVAVRMAAERRLDGVILVAPYDSMAAVARHHYPLLPVGLLLKHRFDSVALAPRMTAPLLCVAATYDEVIPIEHARRLYDAWSGPKRWLEIGTRHNGTDGHPEYWPAIEAFLTDH